MGKIKVVLALSLLVSLSFLTACSSSKLSEDFDEEEIKLAVEEVIDMLNNKDRKKLLETSTVEVRKAFTDEVLEDVFDAIGEGGEFKGIKEMSIGGKQDKDSKEEFAISVTKAEYENKNFTYTITFTKQMKIAGLFYK